MDLRERVFRLLLSVQASWEMRATSLRTHAGWYLRQASSVRCQISGLQFFRASLRQWRSSTFWRVSALRVRFEQPARDCSLMVCSQFFFAQVGVSLGVTRYRTTWSSSREFGRVSSSDAVLSSAEPKKLSDNQLLGWFRVLIRCHWAPRLCY